MPLGINLPGPFTLSRQDKSSKKLLRMQERADAKNKIDSWMRNSEDKTILAALGEEEGVRRLLAIAELEKASPMLAKAKRKELVKETAKAGRANRDAEIQAKMVTIGEAAGAKFEAAGAKLEAKVAEFAAYDEDFAAEILPLALEAGGSRLKLNPLFKARYGHYPRSSEGQAIAAALKQAKQELRRRSS